MYDETGERIQNDRYQPEMYREIIAVAESQGIDKAMLRYIADRAWTAQTGDDLNARMADLDWVMKAVGQVKPELEADMRKNTVRAVRRLLFVLNEPEAEKTDGDA
ncbi:MAG: hypothetical protein M0003_02615 [Acidithiobacillus sp.]|nr:hypothetical protein [Acidithiobacillus sp.]